MRYLPAIAVAAAASVPSAASVPPAASVRAPVDIVLSSGFLCFSRHCGFLDALQQSQLSVAAYVGTSSGALAASMAAAGADADAVAEELSRTRPLASCRPSVTPWRGAFSTRALRKRISRVLPATFEELGKPLGVGVYDRATGEPRLVTSGDLPRAVAASCAVPGLFAPVRLGGALYLDGGAVDRTFLALHKAWRPERRAVCHLVKNDGVELVQRDGIIDGVYVVKTPRANAKLWGLGDFEGERKAAEELPTGGPLAALANRQRVGARGISEDVREARLLLQSSAASFLRVHVVLTSVGYARDPLASASGAGNGGPLRQTLNGPPGTDSYCLSNLL